QAARWMPRACPVGGSRWPLQRFAKRLARCHGIAPWEIHEFAGLAARYSTVSSVKPPRGKPVASLAHRPGVCGKDREPPTGQARGILGVTQARQRWFPGVSNSLFLLKRENLTRTGVIKSSMKGMSRAKIS